MLYFGKKIKMRRAFTMTHILLVDDHQTFLAGTKMILEKHHYTVTTASHPTKALELQKTNNYELFLFDLKLPEMNGYELAGHTLQLTPHARIVILTGEDIVDHFDGLINLGVYGILEKSISEQELVMSLNLVKYDKMVLPLNLVRQLRSKQAFQSDYSKRMDAPLKDNEIEILRLVAQGLKNKDIANQLFMSQRNVEYILSHLFNKLEVASRQEAVLKAIELNVLKVD
jgi:two-component system, NarL family, competent response regulator ComA